MPKKIKNSIGILCIIILSFLSGTSGYLIGLKSRDNSTENIQWVEKTTNIQLPIVSFIFDPRDEIAYQTVAKIPETLGRQRIYHITVSPNNTAKEVSEGKADEMYKAFFELIRDIHIKVVFRTMHEMNGGRYPRSSDPANFAKARQRVWKISREVGLSKEDILFDMSVNGRDIPTRDTRPNKGSSLMFCFPAQKYKLHCPTFEDYYPGDDYVDIMGFTFYNRGKGNTNRLRQNPYDIISHGQWRTLERLKKFTKPLFIDEVGTTTVWYNEPYSQQKSQEVFKNESWRKDARLDSLSAFLKNEPQIIGAIYFNVDLTYGLTNWQQGEADRSIFDPATNKIYEGGKRLFENAVDNNTMGNSLLDAFGVRDTLWGKKLVFVSKIYGKQAFDLLKKLGITEKIPYNGAKLALDMYQKQTNETTISAVKKKSIQYVIDEAYRIIVQ